MNLNLLLASSSRCHPHGYLGHCESELKQLFEGKNEIIFVPFARPAGMSHDEYTETARERFHQIGFEMKGLHQFNDPVQAIDSAEGIFVGGGNTFVLLRDLYQLNLMEVLRRRIQEGMPYMGTSAGSNIAGLSIGTSNDMPIVHPPSFDALAVVPFNINPHFPAEKPDPKHHGETREQRIAEFHHFNDQEVVCLYEDGMLQIRNNEIALVGNRPALVMQKNGETISLSPGNISAELSLDWNSN